MHYNSLSEHLKAKFGCKVYKLALEGGMTCPNRDGTCGTGGCIFCAADGSGAFAQTGDTVYDQIEAAKSRVADKLKDGKYIAYFQSFTNTYAPISYLKSLFRAAIDHPDVVLLSIATRPDCLPEEVLDLLAELNTIKPVWVELGLQTIHPDTARYIRRGYALDVYDKAVSDLKARNIEVITHVILGLPGESREQMLDTVRYVGQQTDGIKLQLLHVLQGTDLAEDYAAGTGAVGSAGFQLLHVLRGTDLAEDYAAGRFRTLELDEYCELIVDCLRVLPEEVVIHRLTGDGAKQDLIAPLWSGDKKRVLNTMNRRIKSAHLRQGEWA